MERLILIYLFRGVQVREEACSGTTRRQSTKEEGGKSSRRRWRGKGRRDTIQGARARGQRCTCGARVEEGRKTDPSDFPSFLHLQSRF